MPIDDVRRTERAPGTRSYRRMASKVCTALGLTGLAFVAIAYLDGALRSHLAIAAFQEAVAQTPAAGEFPSAVPTPDQSLWSEGARAKFAKAAKAEGVPLALLKIERLKLVAPVFQGTDAITLNRGVGLIEGSALPGGPGNIALSAHRDSFFRPLKDIAVGDAIELQTRTGVQHFQVAETRIVDPLDVSVLNATDATILTLITCYPFYYVGYAPDRYVVRAKLVQDELASPQTRIPVAQDSVGE
jgi:sortase A